MISVLLLLGLSSPAALASGGEGAHGFHTWTQLLPGFGPEGACTALLGPNAWVVANSWIVVGLILLGAWIARRSLAAAQAAGGLAQYVPDAHLTVRNLFEIVVEWLHELVLTTIDHKDAAKFFPLIATLFIYIVTANLSGYIPGFLPPTENVSHNLAMALTVFVTFLGAGLLWDWKSFLLHLAGPVKILMPVLFVLETVSLLVRPVSLTARLTINIVIDHLLQTTARTLGAGFGAWIAEPLGFVVGALAPLPLYFLALLVCVVQAFVFTLLSAIYMKLSLPHEAHDESHGDGHAHAH